MRPDHPLAPQPIIRQIAADMGPLILLGERVAAVPEPVDEWLLAWEQQPESIEYVVSIELLLTMVAAGYGVGLVSVAEADTIRRPDLVTRPLSTRGAAITTFLIWRRDEPSSVVARFTERVQKMA